MATAPGDLTTVAQLKAYLRIPTATTTDDTLLQTLITQTSLRIQNDCGRMFPAANYLEFHNISRGQTRVVPFNKPIIRMNRVAWGNSSAFQLIYTGTAVAASAQITPTRSLILTTFDATGSHENSFDLTSASYYLCSQVITAINLVSGFTATLYSNIDVPTKWLFPNVNLTLKSYNSTFTQGFGFASVDIFTYTVDPVYNTVGFQPLTLADFVFGNGGADGLAWPGMYQGLMLDYRGGYETLPGDITLLADQLTADIYYQSQKDPTLTSESLGDYSYTQAGLLLRREYYASMLAPYKRPALAGGMA